MVLISDYTEKLFQLAGKYGAKRMFLFGSVLDDPETAHDIDIAVEGVPADSFFSLYGELMGLFHGLVDLVELDSSYFSQLIREYGRCIYAAS
jgi:predicted nucleotidyltransferase